VRSERRLAVIPHRRHPFAQPAHWRLRRQRNVYCNTEQCGSN
jgi:hypothetical protein